MKACLKTRVQNQNLDQKFVDCILGQIGAPLLFPSLKYFHQFSNQI